MSDLDPDAPEFKAVVWSEPVELGGDTDMYEVKLECGHIFNFGVPHGQSRPVKVWCPFCVAGVEPNVRSH